MLLLLDNVRDVLEFILSDIGPLLFQMKVDVDPLLYAICEKLCFLPIQLKYLETNFSTDILLFNVSWGFFADIKHTDGDLVWIITFIIISLNEIVLLDFAFDFFLL